MNGPENEPHGGYAVKVVIIPLKTADVNSLSSAFKLHEASIWTRVRIRKKLHRDTYSLISYTECVLCLCVVY